MSQYDFGTIDPYVVGGVQLADMLNQWRTAMYTQQRGSSRPSFAQPGQQWINDVAATWVVNFFAGATPGDLPLFNIDTAGGIAALASAMQAVTKPAATNNNEIATTAFVQAAIAAALAGPGLLPTGAIWIMIAAPASTPAGWVPGIAGTIGSAASGATIRANADCQNLYTMMWNGLANTEAPVTGGRGATAIADFTANKPMGGLDCRGVVLAAFDNIGGAAGRLTTLFPRMGMIAGEQAHILAAAELGNHTHTSSVTVPAHAHGIMRGAGVPGITTPRGTFGDGNAASVSGSTESAGPWGASGTSGGIDGGAGGAHNTAQPTRTGYPLIKL